MTLCTKWYKIFFCTTWYIYLLTIIKGINMFNSKNTALIFIDLQNDFLNEGGALHNAVKENLARENLINKAQSVINFARKNNIQIVSSFSDDYKEVKYDYGITSLIKQTKAFRKSSSGVKISNQIEVKKEDLIISKSSISAFANTKLDKELRNRGIDTIIIGGLLTDVCIDSTVRNGYDLGYKVITLTDCMTTTDLQAHEFSVKNILPKFSIPLKYETFIKSSII